ncbi:GTPase HflX [Cardinium endosymbiont of Tipula unca]|uniref:GTPase HflX n=1 Tax=Cardinium endosymbiont of Tipula unca TaxID=3066216 RepID=UPI0030D623FD
MLVRSDNQANLNHHKNAKSAVLIALVTLRQPLAKTEEYLTELAFLARTWGVEVVHKFIQKVDRPHHDTFVGKGKVAEIAAFIKAENIAFAIFDDELSASQVRNLEKMLFCQILDRSLLILNIFAMRAQTKQAKTQVELAQYQYLLPRLTRMWTHLSSQKGGSAGMRGPGEKELETDKRIIQDKITTLRERLSEIEKQCVTRSKSRVNFVRVALVGYTNVGKSTLMKLLAKSDSLAENKLFATVDATVRKVVLNSNPFLLTDTVGFIRKLPHTLVACFKSTLKEIKEADLLLHVVDASHASFHEQISVVNQTLTEIGAENIPKILVFNKIDVIEQVQETTEETSQEVKTQMDVSLKALEGYYSKDATGYKTVFISATEQLHMEVLKEVIAKEVDNIRLQKYTTVDY